MSIEDKIAAALPCRKIQGAHGGVLCSAREHHPDCPAHYRPAVTQLLADDTQEVARLRESVRLAHSEVSDFLTKLTAKFDAADTRAAKSAVVESFQDLAIDQLRRIKSILAPAPVGEGEDLITENTVTVDNFARIAAERMSDLAAIFGTFPLETKALDYQNWAQLMTYAPKSATPAPARDAVLLLDRAASLLKDYQEYRRFDGRGLVDDVTELLEDISALNARGGDHG